MRTTQQIGMPHDFATVKETLRFIDSQTRKLYQLAAWAAAAKEDAMRLTGDQRYFSLLKRFERSMAQLLAPFKDGTTQGKPCMSFLQTRALECFTYQDKEFFVRERAKRKERFGR